MFFIKQKLLDTDYFYDCEYLDKYCEICERSVCDSEYSEIHHIIPRCYFKAKKLEIDNSPENLVKLSLYNHILAHYYLCFCVKNKNLRNRMCIGFNLIAKGKQCDYLSFSEKQFIECLPDLVKLREGVDFGAGKRGYKCTPEQCKHLSEAQRRRSKESREKTAAKNRGKKRTNEQKARMSESRKKFIESLSNEERKRLLSRPMTKEQQEKLRLARIGKKQTEETRLKRSKAISEIKWFNNGVVNTRAKECPEGFVPGRLKINFTDKGLKNMSQSGTKWYNNGIKSCMCVEGEQPEGYVLGRLKK